MADSIDKIVTPIVDAFMPSADQPNRASDGVVSSPPPMGERPAIQFLFGRLNYERMPTVPYQERHFKLDRMFELARRLGHPQDQLEIVHVAGSKGKGSTSTMVSSILIAAGYRVGLYTSPHLIEPEERIRINLQNCSHEEFDQLMETIARHVRAMDEELTSGKRGPTYFEILTAAALLHFKNRQVDIAVIEVGLGGRLDSTNICLPACSVITTISKDHTRQLGDSFAAIAGEKAGIIKQGVPVISGVIEPSAQAVIHERARELASPLVQRGHEFWHELSADGQFIYVEPSEDDSSEFRIERLRNAMVGEHQMENASVAIRAVRMMQELTKKVALTKKVTDSEIRTGLANARCQARIEIVRHAPLTIVDAAHNEASAVVLTKTLKQHWPDHDLIFVLAATRGKDVPGILRHVLPYAKRIIFTRYLENPRCFQPEKLQQLAFEVANELKLRPPITSVEAHPQAAWRAAMAAATEPSRRAPLICVTGSFFLASEILSDAVRLHGDFS